MKEQMAKMTIIELVKTAHNYATSIKQTGVYSDLVGEIASRLEALNLAYIGLTKKSNGMQSERDHLAAQLADVVAENAGLKEGLQQAFEDMEAHHDDDGLFSYDADGEPMDALLRLCDAQISITSVMEIETPATDAFLAEQRASAIPEGYALVPQQIFLDPSDIESICSQCGDGHESGYGDFTDGLLWVGNIQRDDGSIVHGLHISSADYSEEGGVTVCEFAAQLRNEVKV